ncbi:MAG TPA: 50S ribosomal protein L13 [Phycisphaerales bacterium]|nr:50S ribosomal protein L13 [Phycisphaerales bacterium]
MSRRQTTLMTAPQQVSRKYYVVDATDVALGRLAAEVATVLMGKHRPEYTPHVDTGEHVIVTNASKVGLPGNRGEQNFRQRYTEYPGGLKLESYNQLRDRRPDQLVQDAVRRMLPKNRLSRVMLKKLHVFPGAEHSLTQHKPAAITIG